MSKKNLFLLCSAGGASFGILFFALFGLDVGYSWTLAGLCAASCVVVTVVMYIAFSNMNFDMDSLPYMKYARKKLTAFEAEFDEPIEARFSAKMYPPKDKKKVHCAASVCFFQENLRVSYVYARKIYHQDIFYSDIRAAYTIGACFAEIVLYGNNRFEMWLNENEKQAFDEILIRKDLLRELEEKYKDVPFLTVEESVGAPCFEMQFCKSEPDLDREWTRADFCKSDSLYIYHEGNFFDESGSAFRSICCLFNYMSMFAGDNGISADGPGYFDRDKTKYILEKLKETEETDKNGDFQRIIPWLTKAANEYNGFYFLGI